MPIMKVTKGSGIKFTPKQPDVVVEEVDSEPFDVLKNR